MNKRKIYGLTDPRTGEVRYVGQTKNELRKRLRAHIGEAVAHKPVCVHKNNWIRSLLSLGLEPQIVLLEEVQEEQVNEAEVKWIASFHNLTNIATGGNGPVGTKRTPEFIEAMKARQRGGVQAPESNELRRQWSLANKDRIIKNQVKTYEITFPEGHTEIITNLSKFAREHNLSQGNLSGVAYGRISHCRGFRVKLLSEPSSTNLNPDDLDKLSKKLSKYVYTITSPEGVQYVTHSLTKFCKEHELTRNGFSQILSGVNKSGTYKGWSISKEDKNE